VEALAVDEAQRARLRAYLTLVRRRADGSLETPATWIREFVRTHPAYKFDSVVSAEINYDLIRAVDEIERGVRAPPAFLPEDYKPVTPDGWDAC